MAEVATLPLPGVDERERIRQLHRAFFDASFYARYYKELHVRTSSYARHFDFIIGLGTAITGGTGLGILADPAFAWACGIVAAASLILAVAKSTYDWSGKMNVAADLMASYASVCNALSALIDDLNAERRWSEECHERFKTLRDKVNEIPPDRFKELPEGVRRDIQKSVVASSGYDRWWRPYNDRST